MVPRARLARVDTDTMSKKNRFREILGDFRSGKIDILINSAGVGVFASVADLEPADFERMIALNLSAVRRGGCSRA